MTTLLTQLVKSAAQFCKSSMSSGVTGNPSSTRLIVAICSVAVISAFCVIWVGTWIANGRTAVPEIPANAGSAVAAVLVALLGAKVWQSYAERGKVDKK